MGIKTQIMSIGVCVYAYVRLHPLGGREEDLIYAEL